MLPKVMVLRRFLDSARLGCRVATFVMKVGSGTKGRIRVAIIGIAATGLGVLAAVAVAAKPTASISVESNGCPGTAGVLYDWSGFAAGREAGLTVTQDGSTVIVSTTATTGRGPGFLGKDFDIDPAHTYSAHGELRNPGGNVIPPSKRTTETICP